MSPPPMYGKRPVVLLTNDDGPPSSSSPNIFGFSKLLQQKLGWEVRVVVPDCQKSWVGKAYAISDIIHASYFYPRGPDGLQGDICESPRPLKDGEEAEWILLSGVSPRIAIGVEQASSCLETPATCSNIALHNLYPGEIDMVLSGPNHGRNSSTAFSLSSGTIGAALSGNLSVPLPGPSDPSSSQHTDHMPSIAISYGVVKRPFPQTATDLAHEVAVDICAKLWDNWGYEVTGSSKSRTQLYTVNIPLVEEVLSREKRKTVYARMWRSTYGSLFKPTTASKGDYGPSSDTSHNKPQIAAPASGTKPAGPAALPTPISSSSHPQPPNPSEILASVPSSGPLRFKFGPSMSHLLNPPVESLPVGSDAWAFAMGYSSVVPLRAEFAGMSEGPAWFEDGSEKRIEAGQEL